MSACTSATAATILTHILCGVFYHNVAPAEKSLVTLWPCCCKMPSPPNENELVRHLTRRQDLSHTDHNSAPSEAQGSFAAHPVTVLLVKKDIFSFGFLQNIH